MIKIDKEGPWGNTLNGLAQFGSKTLAANTKIVLKAAQIAAKLVVKNIGASGALVGAPFAANSAVTVAMKGSSKPLIDHGDLMGSVTSKQLSATSATAGIFKGHPSGANIGMIMEEGTNRAGRGNKVTIPARPFIAPVAKSPLLQREVEKMCEVEYAKMVNDLFGG